MPVDLGEPTDDTHPDESTGDAGSFDEEAAAKAQTIIDTSLKDATMAGDQEAARQDRAAIKAAFRDSVRPFLEKTTDMSSGDIKEAFDAYDTAIDTILGAGPDTATGLDEAYAAISADPDLMSKMDKVKQSFNNTIDGCHNWLKELGKKVGFDVDGIKEKKRAAYKKLTDAYEAADKMSDPAEANKAKNDALKEWGDDTRELSAELEAGLDKPGAARDEAIEKLDGESNWKKLLKIMGILLAIGSVLGLCLLLAIMGADSDGCYRFIYGDGNTKGTGPIPGSQKPSILGLGGGTVGGKCNLPPNSGNTITEMSCMCGPTVDTPAKAADPTLVKTACTGAGGPSGTTDSYPYCCQGTYGGAVNPQCTTSYSAKGDVYYQWAQIDPSDILGNIINGAGNAAESVVDKFEDILKDLFKHLGPLKWVIYVLLGIVALWVVVEVVRFIHGIFGKKEDDGDSRVEVIEAPAHTQTAVEK